MPRRQFNPLVIYVRIHWCYLLMVNRTDGAKGDLAMFTKSVIGSSNEISGKRVKLSPIGSHNWDRSFLFVNIANSPLAPSIRFTVNK